MFYTYKPRHMAAPAWRKKARATATAAVMAGLLLMPNTALAAGWVAVNANTYDEASSGEGWTWDGADDMTLNGYNGGPISYGDGDLTITLKSENKVENGRPSDNTHETIGGGYGATNGGNTGISYDGNDFGNTLTITGDGSLDITLNDTTDGTESGIWTIGNVVIDGATVSISRAEDNEAVEGISSGTVSIVNDANVSIDVSGIETTVDEEAHIQNHGDGIFAQSITIEDSTVDVQASTAAMSALGDPGEIKIKNSTVDAATSENSLAVYAKSITLVDETGDTQQMAFSSDNGLYYIGEEAKPSYKVHVEPGTKNVTAKTDAPSETTKKTDAPAANTTVAKTEVKTEKPAAPTVTANVIPATGDPSSVAAVIGSLVASGSLLGMGVALRRRR